MAKIPMISMAVAKNSEKNWPVFVKKSCGYVLNMMAVLWVRTLNPST